MLPKRILQARKCLKRLSKETSKSKNTMKMEKPISYEITKEDLEGKDSAINLNSTLGFRMRVILYDPDVPRQHERLMFQYRLFAETSFAVRDLAFQPEIIHSADDKPFLSNLLPWRSSDKKSPHQKLESCLRDNFQQIKSMYRFHPDAERAHLYNCLRVFAGRVKDELESPKISEELGQRYPERQIFA